MSAWSARFGKAVSQLEGAQSQEPWCLLDRHLSIRCSTKWATWP